jgi:type II secretory pathway component PulF
MRFSNKEMAEFTKKLYIMLKSGILISKAFSTISKQQKNPKKKEFLNKIVSSLELGNNLKTTFETVDKENILPQNFKKMLEYTEETGKYAEILEEMDYFYLKVDELERKYSKILFYPKFAFFSLLFALSIYNFTFFLIIVLPLIISYFFLMLNFKNIIIRKIDSFLMNIPFIGKIKLQIIEYNLITLFHIMYDSGVTIDNIFKLLKELYKYPKVQVALNKMIYSLNSNSSLSECFKKAGIFSEEIISMVETGEESGNMSLGLKSSSKQIAELVSMKIIAISKGIAPFMQILGSLILGFAMVLLIVKFFGSGNLSDIFKGLKIYTQGLD